VSSFRDVTAPKGEDRNTGSAVVAPTIGEPKHHQVLSQPAPLVHHRRPSRSASHWATSKKPPVHADPRTTTRFNRAHHSLDRPAAHVIVALVAGATNPLSGTPCQILRSRWTECNPHVTRAPNTRARRSSRCGTQDVRRQPIAAHRADLSPSGHRLALVRPLDSPAARADPEVKFRSRYWLRSGAPYHAAVLGYRRIPDNAGFAAHLFGSRPFTLSVRRAGRDERWQILRPMGVLCAGPSLRRSSERSAGKPSLGDTPTSGCSTRISGGSRLGMRLS
jgi:hypothetical protein